MKTQYKLLLSLILGICLISLAYAEVQNLGTFEVDSCIDLKQTCSNCSYVNLTSIVSPKSNYIFNGTINMQKNGANYNRTFCKSSDIGTWIYCTEGDLDGTAESRCVNFEVTPSGSANNLGFYFIFLLISAGVIILGFTLLDPYITLLGTIGFYFMGIYVLKYGINGIRDLSVTLPISIIMLGIAAYISIKTVIEIIADNYN